VLTNGVFIAILAHGLIGISLVWDKVLLKQPHTQNLVSYVFWLGAISIFGLLLIPFGFHLPNLGLSLLAFFAGVLHLLAVFFYYAALKRGEASQTLAILGGFSPTATALVGIVFLDQPLGDASLLGFALMVGGGFFMFFSETIPWRAILPLVLLSAAAFGFTNVLQKVVFDETNFVSGYVFFTLGTFAGAMALLIPPSWRQQIFIESEETPPRSRFWYMVNRIMAGVGSFLVFLAISRTSPAIVDAVNGLRYVIIFLGTWLLTRFRPLWLKEEFRGWPLLTKTVATALVIAGLVIVGMDGGVAR
jgi:drug/metabolite transporter (DMT)-like permease